MNERERLIELLNDVTSTQYEGDKIIRSEMDINDEDINCIADYLLANGVIVPPCKVGDKIYLIVEKRRRSTNKCFKFIQISKLTFYNLEVVLKCFGKTIFLTKEEAEQALKGGGEE